MLFRFFPQARRGRRGHDVAVVGHALEAVAVTRAVPRTGAVGLDQRVRGKAWVFRHRIRFHGCFILFI